MQNTHEHEGHHGGTAATYNLIFLVLAVLTIGEIIIGELFADVIGATLMMLLTFGKAYFVVAYYMHLKYDPPILTWIFVVPMIMAIAVIISLQGLAGY